MNFKLIEVDNWKRKEYFEHYLKDIPCTYSMTVELDVTRFIDKTKDRNIKFYFAMIYMISSVVNNREEFRMALNEDGKVGIFDVVYPDYTVFHKDTETFSSIWTEYSFDFLEFYNNCLEDNEKYGDIKKMTPKPNIPLNTFPISSIPWSNFTGFNLNLEKGYNYLLPIFTMGKYYTKDMKIVMPLSLQVHHAVCDGFHASRFVNELQDKINNF